VWAISFLERTQGNLLNAALFFIVQEFKKSLHVLLVELCLKYNQRQPLTPTNRVMLMRVVIGVSMAKTMKLVKHSSQILLATWLTVACEKRCEFFKLYFTSL
jgi:hypothetical protein